MTSRPGAPRRWLRVLSVAVMVALPLVAPFGIPSSTAATGADNASGVIQRLGACLAAGGQGEILLSFDTSASLRETDPDDQRVEAASYLMRQLAAYAGDSGAKLEVAVGGFADKFKVTTPWTRLTKGSVGTVVKDIGSYSDRDNGFETDYWSAVDGARRYLTAKTSEETRRCQALVWLSDGMFDLDKRDTSEEREKYGETKPYGPKVKLTSDSSASRVQKAGRADLCRQGGVADQIRSQGVTTLVVGLKATGDPDFTLMKGIAEGTSCGRATSVLPGQFILADQVGDLFFAFDELSDPSHPPISQDSPLCQGTVCREGSQRFVLDSTIARAHLLAGADVENYYLVLQNPLQKQQIRLAPGQDLDSKVLPGATVNAQWLSDEQVQIDLTRTADAGWVGQWGLAFVDPGKSGGGTARSNLRLFGDVRPALVNADELKLVSGKSAQLELGLVHATGNEPVDITKVQSEVSVEASLVLPDGSDVSLGPPLDRENLSKSLTLDLTKVSPGPASVRLTLNLTTAEATNLAGGTVPGTKLEAEQVDVPVTIAPPPNFPRVSTTVSFGSTEEAGDHAASLKVSGPGCVWLDESTSTTLPEGVGSVKLTSSADSAASCAEGSLPLVASVDTIGSGLASGSLVVQTRADSGDEVVPVTVRYELEMQRPRNDTVFWPALVGITLAGILIPVGLLYLVKWRTAKIPGSSLTLVQAVGQVGPESSFLGNTSVSEQGARTVVLAGTDRRSLSLNSQSQLQTRTGLGLTEAGYCVVTGQRSVSSALPGTTRKGTSARLPLAVQDRWVALLDSADPLNGAVEVWFLLSPVSSKLPELVADARTRLPRLVEVLRRAGDGSSSGGGRGGSGAPVAGAVAGGTASDEWGSSSAPPPSSSGGGDWGSTGSPGGSPGGAGTASPGSGSGGFDDW